MLRTVAIVWVMLFHSFVVGGLGSSWQWLSRYGWMGVDLFFVLSGFLIGSEVLGPLARGERVSWRRFYVRRAFRIFPAYWAVLMLYLLWPAFRESPGMEAPWKFFAFLMNLSIDYAHNTAFSHAWSLCVEEHFYLMFPLLAAAMCRRPALWKFASLCVALLLGGIALRSAIWMHDMAVDPGFERNWFVEDIYYPTWNRLDGLLCGVVLASCKAMRPQWWSRARCHANLFLVGGLLLLGLAFLLFEDRVGLLGNAVGWPVLSAALGSIVFAAAGRDGVLGNVKPRMVGWMASISYSLYLVHKAVFHLVDEYWGAQLANGGVLAFLAFGIAAILAGSALHYGVELPFLRLRLHLIQPRLGRSPIAARN